MRKNPIICNRDCFNCIYSDCILPETEISKFEKDIQDDNDKIAKGRKYSEAKRAESRRYYHRHREKCLEKNHRYYYSHKEKFREYDRLRKKTHPISKEKAHEYYVRWRDKKKAEKEQMND